MVDKIHAETNRWTSERNTRECQIKTTVTGRETKREVNKNFWTVH